MTRFNYFNSGDVYSEWHRQFNNISYVDIDCVETCKKCKAPIALMETAIFCNNYFKSFITTQKLANLSGLPAYCILYEIDGHIIKSFRIKQIAPPERITDFKKINPDIWLKVLHKIHKNHDLICEKKMEDR